MVDKPRVRVLPAGVSGADLMKHGESRVVATKAGGNKCSVCGRTGHKAPTCRKARAAQGRPLSAAQAAIVRKNGTRRGRPPKARGLLTEGPAFLRLEAAVQAARAANAVLVEACATFLHQEGDKPTGEQPRA
jgi:hypothetical protein